MKGGLVGSAFEGINIIILLIRYTDIARQNHNCLCVGS